MDYRMVVENLNLAAVTHTMVSLSRVKEPGMVYSFGRKAHDILASFSTTNVTARVDLTTSKVDTMRASGARTNGMV